MGKLGLRAWIFYSAINILIVASVWMAADRIGLLWIVPIMLSINALLLTYGQVFQFSHLQAKPFEGIQQLSIYPKIQSLVQKLDIPMPQFWILQSPTLQAITVGLRPKDTRIYLSHGLINRLAENELLAIITQQLVAAEMHAGIVFYFVAAVSDLVFRIGAAFDKTLGWIFGIKMQLSTWLTTPVIWLLYKILIPKNLYSQIDQKTLEYIEPPQDLAMALWKMESYAKTLPLVQRQFVLSPACAVHPLPEYKPLTWLRTHPPMKSRIKNLVGYFPL